MTSKCICMKTLELNKYSKTITQDESQAGSQAML